MFKSEGKSEGDRTLIYLSVFSLEPRSIKTNQQGLPHRLTCIFEGDLYCPETNKKIIKIYATMHPFITWISM